MVSGLLNAAYTHLALDFSWFAERFTRHRVGLLGLGHRKFSGPGAACPPVPRVGPWPTMNSPQQSALMKSPAALRTSAGQQGPSALVGNARRRPHHQQATST